MNGSVGPQRYRKTSVSMREDHVAGIRHAVNEDGHGNFSRYVQDLVEADLRRRYGRDWQATVGGRAPGPDPFDRAYDSIAAASAA